MEPTQVVLVGRDLGKNGLPRRLALYEMGAPERVDGHYRVPVQALRQIGLEIPPLPPSLEASSAKTAQAMVIGYYEQLARQMRLELLVNDPNP